MDPRRAVPSVEQVLAALAADGGDGGLPRAVVADCVRQAVADARDALAAAIAEVEPDPAADTGSLLATVVDAARTRIAARRSALLGPVLNATGVLLHTNLGRAPLGAEAVDAMRAAAGYANVEYRLDSGARGSRQDHAAALLALAAEAEAGIVVNNNAAAVLLVLAALARDREVIVSRGELVEIGGGFRVPEILAETGARLVEVGTTNRTRLADYERAVTADTAIVLKVHASNYRMVGFTEATSVAQLATLGLPVVVDAGSGLLDERTPWLDAVPGWLADEPGARQCLDAGATLVTFSGDKLLGGPQAGVIVGRREPIAQLARHPLARALRPDKVTLAGLEAVALAYLRGDGGAIPLWRMATATVADLRRRAEAIAATVPGAVIVETEAAAGGGSVPGRTIASIGIAVAVPDVDAALGRLRAARVIGMGRDGRVLCDLRTVDPADDAPLGAALRSIAAG